VAIHRFAPTHYHTAIGWHEPVLHVAPGDTIITTTVDAGGSDASSKPVTPGGNPQTGPFFVDGAAPGDTLVVRLDRLTPSRTTGFTRSIISGQVLSPAAARRLPHDARADWSLDLASGTATLVSPATALGRLTLPLAPMLGCFGVAPSRQEVLSATLTLLRRSRTPRGLLASRGRAISTATSGRYGGNMDYLGFTAGVTVYFPVFVPGALLHVGDGHALQGDGEIIGTGIETSFEVQLTVSLRAGKRIGWPRGETAEHIFTVGNAFPLGKALRCATTEMCAWLREDYALDDRSIGLLLGTCVEYDVGNVYDPAYTLVCKLARRYLPTGA
jgi:acetamidase/formamidase